MGLLAGIAAALALLVAVMAAAWLVLRRRYRLPTPADERHRARTEDGWDLALFRYRPATVTRGREPILLCHGMLSNRFNVDLDATRSLARYLRDGGFDVWVMELRGHGESRRAGAGGPRWSGWTIDDYIQRDAVAAIGAVKRLTGSESLHWYGHSMGGMILYALCAVPGAADAIRSAAISDAPATFAPLRRRGFDLRVARMWGRLVPVVPPALVLPLLGPVVWLRPGVMDRRYGMSDRAHLMRLLSNAIVPWGSSGVLLHLLDMLESGRFRSRDGSCDYEEGAGRIAFPLLVLSAARKLMDEEAVLSGYRRAATETKRYVRFSRANGYSADYTHSNLILSEGSAKEVYPEILRWFLSHSSA